MQLTKYNPFNELQKMQRDFDKFWDANWSLPMALPDWSIMDMYEENGKVVAEFTLPNFGKKDIRVTTENGMLEVTAEHKEKEEDRMNRRYYRRESSNRFWRRVALPEGVQDEKIEATYKDGLLTVSMPMDKKTIEAKAKSVTIK